MASVALLALLPGALLPPDYAVHADTSHMPPLPGGRRLRLLCAPDTSTAGLGGRLWDASSELCAWQLSVANQIRGKRLLELGSGATGACGIFAAGLGASRVVLTDGGNEALMRLLEWNAHAANEEDGPANIHVAPLRWGETAIPSFTIDEAADEGFDWIVASDVTYDSDFHAPLCDSLREALSCGNEGVRAVLCEVHGPPAPLESASELYTDEFLTAFAETAATRGLTLTPFERRPEGAETVLEPAAWPMAAFANGDAYLVEVRLATQ